MFKEDNLKSIQIDENQNNNNLINNLIRTNHGNLLISNKPKNIKLNNLINQNQNVWHNSTISQLTMLRNRVGSLEQKVTTLQSQIIRKRKRIRRKSEQIIKSYQCQICQKRYGTAVSLNLHIRLKHKTSIEEQKEQKENSNQNKERQSRSQQEQQEQQLFNKQKIKKYNTQQKQ